MRQGTDRTDTVVVGRVLDGIRSTGRCDSSALPDGTYSLARLLPESRFFAGDDIPFATIAKSADTAREGELVVYRIGKDCPARLVADAMARGAAGILTEQLLPCPLPQCIVGDIELSLARITAEQRQRPDRKLLTVGVIGSAGKTTTTLLLSSLLRGSGIRTAYLSDLGECDGVIQSTSSDASPVSAELVEWIDEATDSNCRAAVIELSEDDARHGKYDAIEFDLVVVTGSATCSGDYGPSGLQCIIERLTRDGVVIAPADDAKAMRVIRDSGSRVVTYGIRKSADLSVKIMDQSGGMTTLLVTHQDTTAVMETSLCGAGMAANHAAATLFGLLIAQPLEEIVETLGQLRTIPGRGQRLEDFGRATVVLDAGGCPERVATALRTHRSMKSGGSLWCVLAIDGGSEAESLARYGSLLEKFADQSIVTATAEAKTKFLSASHAVLDGVERCAAFRMVADRRRAMNWAIAQAGPNDTILFVTNERNQTAVQQRTDIQRITRWVDSARQQETDPPQLKVFG